MTNPTQSTDAFDPRGIHGGEHKPVYDPTGIVATDPETGRFACTKEHPMPLGHTGQWIHRDAVSDGRDDPYYDHYRCPHCGEHFAVEVAE